MGCVLGPTMANFYMGELEKKVFAKYPELKPKIYVRFVDDTFTNLENKGRIDVIKQKFEENSKLKFTYELESDKSLNFLDVTVKREEKSFATSVFIKSTNNGDCLNFESICPLRYKEGVVKTLLHRAYSISSSWEAFDAEISRIKQLLVNNNYPLEMIDRICKNFVNNKFNKSEDDLNKQEKVNIYFRGQMTSAHKHQELQLKKIVSKNVRSHKKINTIIYYQNMKLKNHLIKNSPKMNGANQEEKSAKVVYQYTCPEVECSLNPQTYIGYTTNALKERMQQHSYKGAIREHGFEMHDRRLKKEEILKSTRIIHKDFSTTNLRILEAIYIKEQNPHINLKDEGFKRTLAIF